MHYLKLLFVKEQVAIKHMVHESTVNSMSDNGKNLTKLCFLHSSPPLNLKYC